MHELYVMGDACKRILQVQYVMGDGWSVYCLLCIVFRPNHRIRCTKEMLMMMMLMQTSQLRAVLHPRKQEKRIMMTLLYGVVSVLFGRLSG